MTLEKRVNTLLVALFVPFNVIGFILLFTELHFLGFVALFVSLITFIFYKDFFLLSLYYFRILENPHFITFDSSTTNPYLKYYWNVLEEANLVNSKDNHIFNSTQNPEKEKDLFFAMKIFKIEFFNGDGKYKQIQNLNLSKPGYINMFRFILSEIMEKEPALLNKTCDPIPSSALTLAVSEILNLNMNNENFIDCLHNDLPELENIKNNLPEKTNLFTIIENKDLIEKTFKEHINENTEDATNYEDNSWKL